MADDLRQGLMGLSQLPPKLDNLQAQMDCLSNLIPGIQADLQKKAGSDEVARMSRVVSRLDDGFKKKAKDEKDSVVTLRADMINSYTLLSSHLEELSKQVCQLDQKVKDLEKKQKTEALLQKNDKTTQSLAAVEQRTSAMEATLVSLQTELSDRVMRADFAKLSSDVACVKTLANTKADVGFLEALNNNFRTMQQSKADTGEIESLKHRLDVVSGKFEHWVDAQTNSEGKIITELNSLSGAYEGLMQQVRELDQVVPSKADGKKFDALVKDFITMNDDIAPVLRSTRRLQIRAWGAQSSSPPSPAPAKVVGSSTGKPQWTNSTACSAAKEQPPAPVKPFSKTALARPNSARGGRSAKTANGASVGTLQKQAAVQATPLKAIPAPPVGTPTFGSRQQGPDEEQTAGTYSPRQDILQSFSGASERGQLYASAFATLIPKAHSEERMSQWQYIDYNGNGQVSLAECDKWIKERLSRILQDDGAGDVVWRAFRPSISCAFKDAADVSKTANSDWVQKSEFRIACAYFAIYGLMYDAFSQLDGSGGAVGSDPADDRRISRDEWIHRYSRVTGYGFVGLHQIDGELAARAAFDEMDADQHGMILLQEWCAYLKKKEEDANTQIGELFKIEETNNSS